EVKARWSALAPDAKPVAEVVNKVVEVRRFRWYEPRDYFHSNIDLSPDGRLLLAGDLYRSTKDWDVGAGQLRYKLGKGKAAFFPQGKQILRLQPGNFGVYEMDTGRLCREFGSSPPGFHSMRLAPNGKTVISGDHQGNLQLWDVETGQEL